MFISLVLCHSFRTTDLSEFKMRPKFTISISGEINTNCEANLPIYFITFIASTSALYQ